MNGKSAHINQMVAGLTSSGHTVTVLSGNRARILGGTQEDREEAKRVLDKFRPNTEITMRVLSETRSIVFPRALERQQDGPGTR